MNILLLVPPGYSVPHAQSCLERLGLGYMTAPLRRDGHTVVIQDGLLEALTWEDMLARARQLQPEIAGVSLMSHHGETGLARFLVQLRDMLPKCHICLGGTFPSINAAPLLNELPEVNSIVCGEGELSFLSLAEALAGGNSLEGVPGLAIRNPKGGIRQSPTDSPIDLDDLLWPARDQLPGVLERNGPVSMISSRGCYARCSFCAIEAVTRALYPRPQRHRSPVDVVNEMDFLSTQHAAHKFYFVDENFMGPGKRGRDRAVAIADEIQKRGLDVAFSIECRCMDVEEATFTRLRDAGLQRVFLGVESVDQGELDTLNKSQDVKTVQQALSTLGNLGIHVEIGFILFTPWSTLESIRAKRRFLESFASHDTGSLGSYLSVMPGTKIEQELRTAGLLNGDWPSYWFEFVDRRAAVLFGLVERELIKPWALPLQRALSHHWIQQRDWSLVHAHQRTGDTRLLFLRELLDWAASERLEVFDRLFEVVESLDLPRDADRPSETTLAKLHEISQDSRKAAGELTALLNAFDVDRVRGSVDVIPRLTAS